MIQFVQIPPFVRLSFPQLNVWVDPERLQMSEFDARDFGKLEAQVEALQKEVHALSTDVKSLLALANKSKGGLWAGMAIASFGGGLVTFVADRLWK
jgi:hypothetical protein